MFKNFFEKLYYGNPKLEDLELDPTQSKFSQFITILSNHFTDLIKLNLIVLLFMLPLIVWAGVNIGAMNLVIQKALETHESISGLQWQDFIDISQSIQGDIFTLVVQFCIGLVPCLLILSLGYVGAQAVLRRWSLGKHSWIVSDFFQSIKNNWKQTLLITLVTSVIILAIAYITWLYHVITQFGTFGSIIQYILIVISIYIILSIAMYAYPMIVSYHLTLKDIFKNSLILGGARLHFTLMFGLLFFGLPLILVMMSTALPVVMVVTTIVYFLIGIAFMMLINACYTTNTFHKYMLPENLRDPSVAEELAQKEAAARNLPEDHMS